MVTWTKVTEVETNPFDGTQETVIQVNDVRILDGQGALVTYCQGAQYTFASGTLDPTIQADVEADLIAKGYNINP